MREVNQVLSIDITDGMIKVVSGEYLTGQIKVRAFASAELDKETVVNGLVLNASVVAAKIASILRTKKIQERETVVCISSNLIIFKELHIPSAKPEQFTSMVKNQMLLSMGIADDYKISYTLAGDIVKNGMPMKKVLVVACPQNIVKSYHEIFTILAPTFKLRMKSMIVSCNCLTKIVMASDLCNHDMPSLFVRLDNKFINLNIYADRMLAFTKYVKINKNDYAADVDYSVAAISDNIFRMLQFYRGLSKQSITQVFLYGDLLKFEDLSAALSSLDISVKIFTAPKFITGCEGEAFSIYANAIGALYKHDKTEEHINLLSTDIHKGNNEKKFYKLLGTVAMFCALFVLIVAVVLRFEIFEIQKNINVLDSYLQNTQIVSDILKVDTKDAMLADLQLYADKAKIADEQFGSKPKITTKILNVLEENAGTDIRILSIDQTDEEIILSLEADNLQAPSQYADNLLKTGFFDEIGYGGFLQEKDTITFTISVSVKGGVLE